MCARKCRLQRHEEHPYPRLVPVWVWNDVSPEDGCTLVRFALKADSLAEVAKAVGSALPAAENRTTSRLLRDGQARKATGDEAAPAAATPGVLLWLDGRDRWRSLT